MKDDRNTIPEGYVPLKDSERRAPRRAKAVGDVDPNERFSVAIVLRRRTDGPPLPDIDYFTKTPPRQRMRLSREEFTEKYGADPAEIKAIEEFAQRNGLTVKSSHAGRRQVVVEGTAAQFSKAFGVSFKRYELPPAPQRRLGPPPRVRTYRGRDGFIYVPKELADSIVGIFGLDNRPISRRNNLPGDTPITNPISVAQAAALYDFPAPGAAIGGQTIGIISAGSGIGYVQSDINKTFGSAGLSEPHVYPISADGTQNLAISHKAVGGAAQGTSKLSLDSTVGVKAGSSAWYVYGGIVYVVGVLAITEGTDTKPDPTITVEPWFPAPVGAGTIIYFNMDPETTQDLAIAGLAAPGANLACYFLEDTQYGWVAMIGRVLHPEAGDFPVGVNPPSVLSSSYGISPGDDPDGIAFSDAAWQTGITAASLYAMTAQFQDAAILVDGPTICVASGDYGSNCGVGSLPAGSGEPPTGDGYAHVEYPGSDPWVLSVGGTTLGQFLPTFAPLELGGPDTRGWLEFPWNAPFPDSDGGPWGTGGGGVSDFFPVPSYQNNAGVPKSVNLSITSPYPSTTKPPAAFNATGRGVPDVAANANIRTGFSGICLCGLLGGLIGNGTSASTPLWAGLIAVLNSNAGFNIGFANPTLYSLRPGAFNPINPLWPDPAYVQLAACPKDNSNNGIPGYPTGPGWDAVTGLGSPNGMEILSGFEALESVYILGGYRSPDIILTDLTTNQPVPIGGQPDELTGTLLQPDTNYGLSANVHNDGSSAANGVVVSFWAIAGGVGTNGSMAGTPQTVNIPARSTVTVNASAPFTSPGPGLQLSAAVSLYSPSTGCAVDATSASEIPDPGDPLTHQCSAWRITNSILVVVNGQVNFGFGMGEVPPLIKEPIILGITTRYVPAAIVNTPGMAKIADTLRAMGARSNQPLYLLPDMLQSLETVDLKEKVKGVHGIEVKPGRSGEWLLLPKKGHKKTELEITGHVPKTAKSGDVLLVNVSAQYPRTKSHAARTVEFLEFVYVNDKKS